MAEIKKILIANRGEIALRVIRTAKEMGIQTVAIFSEVDRNALHVRYADQAVCVGSPPSAQSYLLGDKIIEICKDLNVDAIHPGYGFLSENTAFCRKVTEAGLVFIGPSPEAIEVMGSKLAAKAAVSHNDIPMVPGTEEAITDIEAAKEVSLTIGYPILIKASAGGGGKGMRVVQNSEEFIEQMERAISEAESSFGDGSVFIEKFITSPKHIEFQVIGDQHGNIVHLFDRECSIQRRHQKVIEEAPSPTLTPELREKMGDAAIKVAKACDYYGAGTVEFIMDENRDFFFLEMNTRLQVEHPVTEEITGVDLVKEQIRIAEGKTLSFKQEDLSIHGHSIECRVYAEDPANNFLPDIGKLETYIRPQGTGIRVDDGFEEGMDIPIYYDPMIAKLVTKAGTRQDAIDRMVRAIDEYKIIGLETTILFCKYVLQHKLFVDGSFDTNFVGNHFTPENLRAEPSQEAEELAALLAVKLVSSQKSIQPTATSTQPSTSKWKSRRS